MRQKSYKEKILTEVLFGFDQRNLPEQVREYKEILDTLIILQEFLAKSGVKVPKYIAHIDLLTSKILLHSNTIYYLLSGIELEIVSLKFKKKILDIPSLFILLRAQLENFLIFDFIYCQTKSKEETLFRYNNWMYAGYMARSSTPATTQITIKKKQEDIIIIDELKKLIQNSEFFKLLKPLQQKGLIEKGNDRLFVGWLDIMLASGFKQQPSRNLYKLISSYAHTSSLSVFNFSEVNINYTENNDKANLIVTLSKVILSKFIVKYKQQVKAVEIKYNMLNRDLIKMIEFYAGMLDEKSKFLSGVIREDRSIFIKPKN